MFTKRWLFFRVLVPLVLAGGTQIVHLWFPRNTVAELTPVFMPFLAAVINLAASSLEGPTMSPRNRQREFKRRVGAWHALEGLGCLILMLFEACSAIAVSIDEIGIFGLLITIPALFLPYLLVAMWARTESAAEL